MDLINVVKLQDEFTVDQELFADDEGKVFNEHDFNIDLALRKNLGSRYVGKRMFSSNMDGIPFSTSQDDEGLLTDTVTEFDATKPTILIPQTGRLVNICGMDRIILLANFPDYLGRSGVFLLSAISEDQFKNIRIIPSGNNNYLGGLQEIDGWESFPRVIPGRDAFVVFDKKGLIYCGNNRL